MNHIAEKVVVRFKVAVEGLLPGDYITVWMKKGDWWSEMRRGADLKVTKVEGDRIWLSDGSMMGQAFEMQIVGGPDKQGRYKLDATGDWQTRWKRGLVVTKTM